VLGVLDKLTQTRHESFSNKIETYYTFSGSQLLITKLNQFLQNKETQIMKQLLKDSKDKIIIKIQTFDYLKHLEGTIFLQTIDRGKGNDS